MKITFLGTENPFTLGNQLLLETFLGQLGQEHHYAVGAPDPLSAAQMLQPRFDVETFHPTRQAFQFIKHLLASRLLFFGGSAIREQTSGLERAQNTRLAKIFAVVTFTRLATRSKIIMSNVDIGPFLSPIEKRLAQMILTQVDFISVRDWKSLSVCLELGINAGKVCLVPDATFTNTPEVLLPILPDPGETKDTHLALNLSYDMITSDGLLANLAEALTQLHTATPLVIHTLPAEDKDSAVLQAFLERIADIPHTSHNPQTTQETAEILARCAMVIAGDPYTLTMAAILGRPFLGLIHHPRIRELVNQLGVVKHCLDTKQPFEATHLLGKIEDVLKERVSLQGHLSNRSSELCAELESYFNEIRELIAESQVNFTMGYAGSAEF